MGARGAHLRQMSLQSFLKDLLLLFVVCAVFIYFLYFLCVFVLFGQVVIIVDGRVGGFRAGQTVNTHTHTVGTR